MKSLVGGHGKVLGSSGGAGVLATGFLTTFFLGVVEVVGDAEGDAEDEAEGDAEDVAVGDLETVAALAD